MDPVNPNILYYGSQRLYKTIDRAYSWTAISSDLSNGPYPTYPSFGTITTIDVAHNNTDVIYVGTDDGNIWVTQNGGTDWTQINAYIPNRWVTRVTVDPRDDAIVYATISGHDWFDPMPHIFRSDDYGDSWTDIAGNLPDAPVNDVIPDPHDENTLWIAGDYGVYVTHDLGTTWEPLGTGMPIVPVHDIDFHVPTRTLAAGTHGRSIYKTGIPCPDDIDTDGDGIMNTCDNCPLTPNPDQSDINHNLRGDICEGLLCGDIDDDGLINILDVVFLINYLYKSGPSPAVMEIADVNGDVQINILDVVYLINFLYKGGPDPACE
jgi:hypothetical protein